MDEAAAINLVWARLTTGFGKQGDTFRVVGAREDLDIWYVSVQPYRPDGQPYYDVYGFDVVKATGEVRHMK
jgi:hypothetical protein